MKIAIIGAGAAGMTAAYTLSKANLEVDVYESSSSVGGLARTMNLWNQKVDIGPHRFFSSDRLVNEIWLELIGDDYKIINGLTRIFYKEKFLSYPIKFLNLIANLGFFEIVRCIFSYLKVNIITTIQDGSFETWVQSRFGKRLYTIFFKQYSEKLWGIQCKDLDSDFAAQRIKKLSMYEAIKNIVFGGKGNQHKTLVDQFAYPNNGSGVVYERMADFVRNCGNNVHLDTPVFGVHVIEGKVVGVRMNDGTIKEYDHVISSMPYTLMVNRLPCVPEEIKRKASELTFRNTIIVYLLIDCINLFSDNWLYIHSPNVKMGRVTNFRNWVPTLYNEEKKTILAIEYWCDDNDAMWQMADVDLIQFAKKEVRKTKLVSLQTIEEGYVHKVHRSYPVYKKGYKKIVGSIDEYLSTIDNLSVIGRYGSFKYNNQDHSILMGLLAAQNIIGAGAGKHKLSEVNNDYDSYQERYVITQTGLQKQ